MFKAKNGFTLIELLIVIVIIGILAGIVVGIVGTSANNKAQDAKKKAIVHELQNALEQYYLDQNPNAYPTGTMAEVKTALVAGEYLSNNTDVTDITYDGTSGYTVSFTLKNQNDNGDNVTGTAPTKIYSVTAKQQ